MSKVNIADFHMEGVSVACALMTGIVDLSQPSKFFTFDFQITFISFDGEGTIVNFSEALTATPFVIGYCDKDGEARELSKEALGLDLSLFDEVEKIYNGNKDKHSFTCYKIDKRKLIQVISKKIYEASGIKYDRCKISHPEDVVILAYL